MSLPAFATPIPALQRPLPPAALLRSEPYDDPQYLVLAVELARLATQWRARWPGLRLSLPQSGTWPLESWPDALGEALDAVLEGALARHPHAALELSLSSARGELRLDLQGYDPQARAWLPEALPAARRLAAWQGGHLLWRAPRPGKHGGWKVRLELPLSPARR
ncbi:hypothetical protein N5J43_25270 [Pseudomonas nicosulfuronedens]|uniref:Uncharacterized protein n=1 Tax=Pseudomonas nicosulfuronedens TaxID=2571105 RepID=A0A5R9R783_9PSED|nr:hypothetical protein [Pseudomonas nicosulfuronedens]MDH1012832.1 hypothetical protein [Pseudomonas nicosulfuronedens]MDH1982276.1 hypothetical protein [Pseudomonas nicosulfuronedens]MDH2026160.1 hypothetical protein [Pseudomonas nicosulfuronedens]TLX77890.1 hypothetical protein FAS41_12080 [Pseudomonas nicosulfuronedens]